MVTVPSQMLCFMWMACTAAVLLVNTEEGGHIDIPEGCEPHGLLLPWGSALYSLVWSCASGPQPCSQLQWPRTLFMGCGERGQLEACSSGIQTNWWK